MTHYMKILALFSEDKVRSYSSIVEAMGGSRGAANRALAQLRERGDLRLVSRGVYKLVK